MIDCSSGKICYLTRQMGEAALIDNHARYNYSVGQGPINIYKCELCDCYHFTSKGELHPLLKDDNTQQKISQLRQGRDWEDKLGR